MTEPRDYKRQTEEVDAFRKLRGLLSQIQGPTSQVQDPTPSVCLFDAFMRENPNHTGPLGLVCPCPKHSFRC